MLSTMLPKARSHDSCGAVSTLQNSFRRCGFFAGVAHSDDARRVPGPRRARDVAHFFAAQRKERVRLGHGVAGEEQLDAVAVYLAARAHALDDLLSCVAAFGVADVAVLQTRFVRNLFFAEIVAEPRHALSEAGGAQGRVPPLAPFVPSQRIRQKPPTPRPLLAVGKQIPPR